ncbi:hypothetical protein KUTeg_024420 [Tegillarca granosa]|uniref:Transcriptional regulator ATRX homolog n=1 Tax=Tegillarca granosa TaxID=220873 RepID=A0ABQ9DX86_TEGGR|nr:hypothetical protein KUTeg_024420 [Tegillarca granosa]
MLKRVRKTRKKRKKSKKKTDDSSSDDDDNGDDDKDDNYDDETEEEKEETGDLPFDKNDEDTEEENKDENDKAKEDLLKELQDSTTEDGSSDSEVVINSPKKKANKKKSSQEDSKASDDTDSDVIGSPKKKKTRCSLLEAKLSDSDSDFQTPKKKRGKKRKASSSGDKSESESDSESDKKKKRGKKGAKGKKEPQKGKRRRRIKKQSSSEDDGDNVSDEGEGSDEESQTPGGVGKRRKIRKVKSDKKLTDATKEAVKAEEDRRKRIAERQKQFNNIVQEVDENSPVKCPMTTQLVLEEDKETKKPIIEIDRNLVRQLKPHQVEAVQFIWDCTMETLERAKKEEGAGCILAHCMGLGKTLTLITFIHTMLVNQKKTKIRKALVVCPLNTVLNWQREFEMWQEHTKKEVEVFELSSVKQNFDRAQVLQNWHDDGGVMIMGYEMFRILSGGTMCRNKKQKQIFAETLTDPGPDLVVCDEGHILKNDTSSISKAMNKIRTKRRVVLTGTPLQNNLVEYHCMVNFVKPNLLGTSKEFRNRFVNPICNGQCADSTMYDVKVMKRRAHILHEKLAGCVQRKDYSALTKFLPKKHEYVISVRLSKVQMELYARYLNMTIGDSIKVSNKGGRLFQDYQNLMRIWTHPWVLKMDEVIKERRALFEEDDEFIDDSMSESDSVGSGSKKSSSSSSEDEVIPIDSESDSNKGGKRTRSTRQSRQKAKEEKESENSDAKEEPKREVFAGEVVKKWTTRSRGNEEDLAEMLRKAQEEEENKPLTTEWWAEYVSKEDFNRMELSGKLMLLFEILRMCEEIGDKILVFSQSLLSLDLIEDFLEIVDNKHQEETKDKKDEELADDQGFGKHWTKGEDYFRMDGSTNPQQRKDMAIAFNDPENYRARLFLISTKAGSLGINLVGANRVIIFDASWNPSHDVQSIFRVYRFGQTKPVYVYRFLAQATMEEKIYERQIIKLSLSQRVVDEHQIERHFNASDLQELYTFKPDRLDDPNRTERPTPVLPKDHMLAELFKSHKDWIVTYHEHDSLLENKTDEELSEEERKAAWEDYEQEQKGIRMSTQNFLGNMRLPMPGMNQMGFNMPMPGMRMPGQPGMPQMALNHHHLLQLVQEMKAKVEQQEMQHHQQLQQIQAQIRRQQQQMNMRYPNPSQQMRMGMNPNSNFGGMRPRMAQPGMRTNSIIGSMIGNGTSSNPINLEAVTSPPSGSKQGKS